MANPTKRVPENVPGAFFVDTTCIDCDTCRQLAPAVFGETGATAYVHHQPGSVAERREAVLAALACPTGSIGGAAHDDVAQIRREFPLSIEGPVFYCGFNSPKSFGGNSYFIEHAGGNWLVDSPKFLPQLVRAFEKRGGIANVFLTHSDDVADADRYARQFAARRVIHRNELASQPGAECVLDGDAVRELSPGFLAIPTPGHTAGHCVLLFDERFLFTGDHLDFDRDTRRLSASRSYCWYSWTRQTESMRRLARFRFEWVLPGHGQRVRLPADEMRRQTLELAERMQLDHD
jgi:glyoxylase-like metal-dependent hydrolase (beta-lactamase superfamily II)/ferredoxin